jgi:hypothetical protein
VVAVLATLWTVDANYLRAAALTDETAQLLAHYRPAPEHVEVTRTAVAMSLINALAVRTAGAARMLYVLRRLPPAPPDTPIRAVATVLTTPDVFAPDHAVLDAMIDGEQPHVAAVAGLIRSYYAEHAGELPTAIEASKRGLAVWATSATPWLWIMFLGRLGELTLRVERSEDSLRYFSEGVRLLGEIGVPRDVVGVYWGMMLAHLQLGHLDEAEYWLGRATADNAGNPEEDVEIDIGTFMFVLAARAELALARGEVDTGLRLWRRASVARDAVELPEIETGGDSDDLRPWALETQAGALGAHALVGRLDLVPELLAVLPGKLATLLENPLVRPPVYVVERQLVGALLVAIGMADIAAGDTSSGVRFVALAEKFKYLRGFRPATSVADIRAMVENADGPAYADAMSEYAGLDRDGLRAAALAALLARRG